MLARPTILMRFRRSRRTSGLICTVYTASSSISTTIWWAASSSPANRAFSIDANWKNCVPGKYARSSISTPSLRSFSISFQKIPTLRLRPTTVSYSARMDILDTDQSYMRRSWKCRLWKVSCGDRVPPGPLAAIRLHRTRCRLHISWLVPVSFGRLLSQYLLVPAVAFPHGPARDAKTERLPPCERQEDYFPGSGWPGSSIDRAAHGGGQAAQPGPSGCAGQLPALANHLPSPFAGSLVNLCDRCESGEAQYLRLPRPQPEILSAATLFGAARQTGASVAPRTTAYPACAPGAGAAPEKPAILENPRRAGHRMHHPARANHFPAREVRWEIAFGDVHAGLE